MWRSLLPRFHATLRYKLLALVLLPLLGAMAVTLGYTLYWLHGHSQESLDLTLRDHLAAARQSLRQAQEERQLELQQLADSPAFQQLLAERNAPAIQRTLQRLRDAKGYAFLHLTGVAGNWLFEDTPTPRTSKPSPLTDRALRGFAGTALEIFRTDDLRRESDALVEQARMPGAAPGEERSLILRLVQPIANEQGRVTMTLDAGLMLNNNHNVLYTLNNRVFGAASLPAGASPIIALLLDDTRIAIGGDGWNSGLIGDRLAPEMRAAADARRDLLIGREPLHGERFVSAYGPLYDVNGQRVGWLQVGMREAPFRAGLYRSAGALLALFLGATGLAAWFAVRGVRSVFQPIETMAEVARATRAGEDRRIGPIARHDEIGELARQFDSMLDELAARNREIQRSAAALEVKVAERTRELARKNTELRRTVALLKKTQEQLVLADKLSALGRMAAGIAHEINNPAAVIQGNLDVLSTELGPAAHPVEREIELISQQVERIRHIVTSLLQFARARPGQGPLAEVSVNQLVQDVLPLTAHVLKARSLELACRLEAHGQVAVNPFDLEQVLINLIANAARACEAGGTIEIETADQPEGAVIAVRDNGCGIPRDKLKRIFDPFFTTDPRLGAGLGLSVSYGLVQRYGGRITVESSVGQGSTFRVWLRRRPDAAPGATEPSTANEEVNYG